MGYKITDEEINKVKLNSPFALPNSPSERGMKPEAIKEMFWKAFAVLIELINKYLSALGDGMATNKSDVINQINSLRNGLSKEVESLVNTRLDEAFEQIVPRQEFDEHIENYEGKINENIERINGLEGGLEVVGAQAESAYNLAAGKSRIIPVGSVRLMLGDLMYEEQERGDLFVIGEGGVPEFMFCRRSEAALNGDITFTEEQFLSGEITFEPGKYYYFADAKKQLLTIEGGFDTSALVTKEELGDMEMVLDYIISAADLYIGGAV